MAVENHDNEFINNLLEGVSWSGATGQAVTIKYTFGDASSTGGFRMDSTDQLWAQQALQTWANYANISFQSIGFTPFNNPSSISFAIDDLSSASASGVTYWSVSGDRIIDADVFIDFDYNNFALNNFDYLTLIHEVGHALGLSHPADYSSNATPSPLDTTDVSIMSYYDGTYTGAANIYPATPMIYDIGAIQHLYGANTSYNAGNTNYNLTGVTRVETLWDGSGNDALISTSYGGNVVLDLREGAEFITHVGATHLWNAYNANIEQAISGNGNDALWGNALSNYLVANSGNDLLDGGAGNDTMQGNTGSDSLTGGDGDDFMRGGKDGDYVQGNQGNDSTYGDDGNDTVYGGKGDDYVQGNQGADIVNGNIGNDTIHGGQDSDSLRGGQGDDLIFGDLGVDYIYGDKGNDIINGGEGADFFYFNTDSGNDLIGGFESPGVAGGDVILIQRNLNSTNITDFFSLMLEAQDVNGDVVFQLGNNNTLTIDNVTFDMLSADDFGFF